MCDADSHYTPLLISSHLLSFSVYFSFLLTVSVRASFTFGDILFPTVFPSAIICDSRFRDGITVPFYVTSSCVFLRLIRVSIIHVIGSDHGQTMPVTIVLSRTELLHNRIIVAPYFRLETHPASRQPYHHWSPPLTTTCQAYSFVESYLAMQYLHPL